MNVYITVVKIEWKEKGVFDYITSVEYSLEDAVQKGVQILKENCMDYLDADSINERQIKRYYQNKKLYYDFRVLVVSGNRKRFSTSEALMNYYKTEICNYQSGIELYEFLLTLVESDLRIYNYKGKLIGSCPVLQVPKHERAFSCLVDFSMESCIRRGYHQFSYD